MINLVLPRRTLTNSVNFGIISVKGSENMDAIHLGYTLSKNDKIKTVPEVVEAGIEQCKKGHSYGPASREYYLIHFVLEGSGYFERGDGRYEVKKNQAFIIRPGEVTFYKSSEENPWKYAWIGVKGESATEIMATSTANCAVMPFSAPTGREIESAITLNCDDPVALPMVLCGVFLKAMAEFYASLEVSKPEKPDVIKSAVRYIENNYIQPFDVTQLAKELGVSRSYFTTIFTESMDCSPYKYLLRLRIEKAQKMLCERASLSVTEIAYSVGFSSVERFSETFTKYVGLSPLAYRKANAKTSG